MQQTNKNNNFKRNIFYMAVLVSAIALIVATLISEMYMSKSYEQLVKSARSYINYEKEARNIEDASDYLTTQVQRFVQLGDIKYAELFIKEITETKRRKNALNRLMNDDNTAAWVTHAEKAVEESDNLIKIEFYAMKLASAAFNIEYSELPEEIQKVTLSEKDFILSPSEKREKARNLVFGNVYMHSKSIIYEHLLLFTRGILFATEEELSNASNELARYIMVQKTLILLLAVCSITSIAILIYLIRPLCVRGKAEKQ